MNLTFDEMLKKVYSFWPSTIGSLDDSVDANAVLADFEDFYESNIAPLVCASGSSLLIQLDWIVYGAVCRVLKSSHVVRLNELRVSYLSESFHKLLQTVGLAQLRGEREIDGSFDMKELAAYLKFADSDLN